MILEARTLSDLEAVRLRVAGWLEIRREGSEILLRWPLENIWPPDPLPPSVDLIKPTRRRHG